MNNELERSPGRTTRHWLHGAVVAGVMALGGGCLSGGGGDGDGDTGVSADSRDSSCSGSCADADTFLDTTDVQRVIAQAVQEADARDAAATIAVVDRVGNVLAVYRMKGAQDAVTITSGGGIRGGLEGINIIPDTLAAISKAVTAAYLSSEGNAFNSRTASQIVQENFNPREKDQPSGPLFGVQFSQLPCSDLSARFGKDGSIGPKRAPLGLSADPGSFPLYLNGTPVGGVGVIADGIYGLDKDITNFDDSLDEAIALAGSFGYAAPEERRADRITVLGKTLRFSDLLFDDLAANPARAPAFDDLTSADGALVKVTGYYSGDKVLQGVAFGQPASGIRPSRGEVDDGLDGFVLVDKNDVNRYPPRAGSDSPGDNPDNRLDADEVRQILADALSVANRARAQIRAPLNTPARVTVSVVDTNGTVLGLVRSRDAPVFGIDVSLQKARTAAFFSATGSSVNGLSPAEALRLLPPATYLDGGLTLLPPAIEIGDYVTALQGFLGVLDALEADGDPLAFSDRAGGNLSRPHYPDGPVGGPAGPLSKPPGQWSVFSTGLQLDLAYNAIIHHVGFVAGAAPTDVDQNCTGDTGLKGFTSQNPIPGLANGTQIFPGSVPIYRGDVLVGGIGVSGDGVDQDDMVAFLGLDQAARHLSSGIGNAPKGIRPDRLQPRGVRLRFVNCPFAPFIGSDEQAPCDGR